MAAPRKARIQTLEEIAVLVTAAVFLKKPISAMYHNCRRSMCPHVLGRNKEGGLNVLCYQYAGESVSGLKARGSSDNWRCVALPKLSSVRLLLEEPWHTAINHQRPQTCITEVLFDSEKLSWLGDALQRS
jgi:hypothetical protein